MTATITTIQNGILASLSAIASGSPVIPFTPRIQEADSTTLPNEGDPADVIIGFESTTRLGQTGATILDQTLVPITIKRRYSTGDQADLDNLHALAENIRDAMSVFHSSTVRVEQLLMPHPFDVSQAVGPGVFSSRFVLDLDVLRPVAAITQDVTTPTKILTSVRRAVWNALTNWPEWSSPFPWTRTYQQDSDLDELSLHDPGEFDLPALAVTWGPTAPRFLAHTVQDWPATINVTAWLPAYMTTVAEYRAWQIVRAIYQCAPSGSPVSYIRAATGRIPEKDTPISFEPVELGRGGQLKAVKLTCQFVLTGIVSPLTDS